MAKIVCTIWALILHYMGIYIFQDGLSSSGEDYECEEISIVSEQPITSFLFTSGIYVIITQISLVPSVFQEPPASVLCLYELLATLFILEFCLACIWNPLDVLMLSTLPKTLSHLLCDLQMEETGEWIVKNQMALKTLTFFFSLGFFLVSLHVSKAVDFSVISEYGVIVFTDLIVWNIYQRIKSELPNGNSFVAYLSPKRRCLKDKAQQTVSRCRTCRNLKN